MPPRDPATRRPSQDAYDLLQDRDLDLVRPTPPPLHTKELTVPHARNHLIRRRYRRQ
jgi:hypothetical protein